MQDFDVVITSGGVGPTHDDITIYSVARALNQSIRENKVRKPSCFFLGQDYKKIVETDQETVLLLVVVHYVRSRGQLTILPVHSLRGHHIPHAAVGRWTTIS